MESRAVAFLAAAVSVAYWPGLPAAAVAPRWALIAAFLPFISKLRPDRAFLPVALTLGWASLSLLWSPDRAGGAFDLYCLFLFAGVILAALEVDDLAVPLEWFACGVAISALLAVGQVLGFSPVRQLSVPAGLFDTSLALGEVAAPIGIWALLSGRVELGGILLLAVGLSGSRVGTLAAIVGAAFAFLPRRRLWLLVPLVAIAGSLLAWHFGIDKARSAGERLMIWEAALAGLSPLGHGIGWFAWAHPYFRYAHSDVLQALDELGIGALPLLGFLGWLALGEGERPTRAAFAAFCVEGAIAFPLHQPALAFLGALLAGALLRSRLLVRDHEPRCADHHGAVPRWAAERASLPEGGR